MTLLHRLRSAAVGGTPESPAIDGRRLGRRYTMTFREQAAAENPSC